MQQLTLETRSAEETQSVGRRLGALAEPGDLFLLHGALGTGKTTFTQGMAWGAGVTGYAHSPTFVLVHEYQGRIRLYHLDLYRLEAGVLEAHDLGIEEMLDNGACVVEWADRTPEVFPGEHLAVRLELAGTPEKRIIDFTPQGQRYQDLLDQLAQSGVGRDA